MFQMSKEFKDELSEMVVTCGEFKNTVLKIFEALLAAPTLEVRKKPKLSIFDGGSFDKMYKQLEKLINEWGKYQGEELTKFNLRAVDDSDCKKLIKVLKGYKGKNSPHKLKIVKELLQRLEARKFINYGEVKNFYDELNPLYGKKEIYNSASESSKEIAFWEEVNKLVSTWPDADPLNNLKMRALSNIYRKYKNVISQKKQQILDRVMLTMESNADRYTNKAYRVTFGNKVYEDMKQMADQINNLRTVPNVDDKFGKNPLKSDDLVREHSAIKNRRCAADKIFNDFWNETGDDLCKGWNEFDSRNMTSSAGSLIQSIGTYSAHYHKGSAAIDTLFEYLLKGFAICFMTCDFYGKLTDMPKLTGETPEEQKVELKKIRDNLLSKNATIYKTDVINNFVEQLKTGKF